MLEDTHERPRVPVFSLRRNRWLRMRSRRRWQICLGPAGRSMLDAPRFRCLRRVRCGPAGSGIDTLLPLNDIRDATLDLRRLASPGRRGGVSRRQRLVSGPRLALHHPEWRSLTRPDLIRMPRSHGASRAGHEMPAWSALPWALKMRLKDCLAGQWSFRRRRRHPGFEVLQGVRRGSRSFLGHGSFALDVVQARDFSFGVGVRATDGQRLAVAIQCRGIVAQVLIGETERVRVLAGARRVLDSVPHLDGFPGLLYGGAIIAQRHGNAACRSQCRGQGALVSG